jgi:hypothetical protein
MLLLSKIKLHVPSTSSTIDLCFTGVQGDYAAKDEEYEKFKKESITLFFLLT